jgi:hypothetical protein
MAEESKFFMRYGREPTQEEEDAATKIAAAILTSIREGAPPGEISSATLAAAIEQNDDEIAGMMENVEALTKAPPSKGRDED